MSPESQPNPQRSQPASPAQTPRLASSNSDNRNRANKTRYPALYDRGKAALEWDTHVQSRQILRSQINFTELQNDAIRPPSPLNRHKIWLQNKKDRPQSVKRKPKLSVCSPNEVANVTALGFQPLSQSVVEGVEKFVLFVGYPRSGHSLIASVMFHQLRVIGDNSGGSTYDLMESGKGSKCLEQWLVILTCQSLQFI